MNQPEVLYSPDQCTSYEYFSELMTWGSEHGASLAAIFIIGNSREAAQFLSGYAEHIFNADPDGVGGIDSARTMAMAEIRAVAEVLSAIDDTFLGDRLVFFEQAFTAPGTVA